MTAIKRILARFGFVYRAASGCYQALRRIAGAFFCLFPIQKNKIVFDNFCGKGYGGFPARLADELRECGVAADCVWLTADRDAPLPRGVRRAEYGSLLALYETVTASVWIDNVMGALNAPKRKGQLYLNTWHSGGIGLKKVEASVEEYLDPAYVRGAKKDAEKIDYMLSASRWQDDEIRSSFWFSGKTLPVAYADVKSAGEQRRTAEEVRRFFALPQDVSLVLYAPTFRGTGATDCFRIDYPAVLAALEERFGGKWVALVRLHPNDARRQGAIGYSDDVRSATDYPDIEDLLYAADLLITDFSSSFFEAMRYGRRSLLYAADYEEYVRRERPLWYDIRTLPPPFAGDRASLLNAIRNFDDEAYAAKAKAFVEGVGYYSDKKDLSAVTELLRNRLGPSAGS